MGFGLFISVVLTFLLLLTWFGRDSKFSHYYYYWNEITKCYAEFRLTTPEKIRSYLFHYSYVLQRVLEKSRFHIDSLLTFSDIYKVHDDLKMAREMVGKDSIDIPTFLVTTATLTVGFFLRRHGQIDIITCR